MNRENWTYYDFARQERIERLWRIQHPIRCWAMRISFCALGYGLLAAAIWAAWKLL